MTRPELLTKEEVMAILHVGRTTLQGFIARREIRYSKVGRRVLFRIEDVTAFVDRRSVSPRLPKAQKQARGR